MVSYNYSNFTVFGNESKGHRYAWAAWYIFLTITSLLGDTAILLAAVKYKAFQLHKVIITFIQHIAVCDLIYSTTYLSYLPSSIISNRWTSGKALCYITAYTSFYFPLLGCLLICGMTVSKFLLLKYPLRSRSWTRKLVHKVCVGFWLASLYIPVALSIIDTADVIFDNRVLFCRYGFSSRKWNLLKPITYVVVSFTPTLIVIAATTLLLLEGKKVVRGDGGHKQSLKWQGIVAVVLTATFNTLAKLPYMVYVIFEFLVKNGILSPGPFLEEFLRIALGTVGLNTISNFFIYSLTVRSFRAFLCIRIRVATFRITNTISRREVRQGGLKGEYRREPLALVRLNMKIPADEVEEG